ncbi:MAG TPA: hypothetical protein VHH34_01150 [Pseudonocardiaceae bacterium]|nr:hypothetical protein [Pseudonocardiaceae bacterium]
MLEGHLRARVAALPNVTQLERFDIVGLLSTPDARRVTGARVMSRADGSTATQLPADLVLDATGRGSRMPAWLQALGYQPPAQDRVPIDLRYATRSYRLSVAALVSVAALGGDLVIVNAATPEHRRGGILQILPGGRAMVTQPAVSRHSRGDPRRGAAR